MLKIYFSIGKSTVLRQRHTRRIYISRLAGVKCERISGAVIITARYTFYGTPCIASLAVKSPRNRWYADNGHQATSHRPSLNPHLSTTMQHPAQSLKLTTSNITQYHAESSNPFPHLAALLHITPITITIPHQQAPLHTITIQLPTITLPRY